MRVIGYRRVSHEDSARTGYGLDDQRRAIETEAQRRGWTVMWLTDEARSAKAGSVRPALERALDALQRHVASALVVAKLDRLARDVGEFAALVERSQRQGWQLVILDLGVDTTTPAGRLVANVFAALAQWEREVIAERTRAALRAAQRRGVRLGRPSAVPAEVRERIRRERQAGRTLREIAAGLNRDAIPTAQGGRRWWPSTVARLLREEAAGAA